MRMTVMGGFALLAMQHLALVVIWILAHVVRINRDKVRFKLVATRAVLPMLLLILHCAFLFSSWLVGGTESPLVVFFLLPLYPHAIGRT
jgi:hypothetical protein